MVEGVKKSKKECSPSQGRVDVEDRISGLPDFLIHHILSFLTMKGVVRTCILSRRWRYLWTSVPVLDFGNWEADTVFIDRSLLLYEGRKIQRFRVHVSYEDDLYSWIRFVLRRDVEELVLRRDVDELDDISYKLPRCVLDCGSLRVLKLEYCALNTPATFSLCSLTTLHLYCVKFTDLDASNCPLLQDLIIEECGNTHNIYAPNQKLRYFKIVDFESVLMYSSTGVTLCAPYLLLIEISGLTREFYNLNNLSSIKSARLDLYNMDEYCSNYDGTQLVELLKNLSHAKTLKLCQSPIQMLACRERENLKTPHLSATCLELESNLTKSELPGIANALRL